MIKKVILSAVASILVSATAMAKQPAATLDELLQRVEQGRVTESKEHKEREARFLGDKAGQDRLLREARNKRTEEERAAARLGLQKLPRNANPTRLRNRCELTGRGRGTFRMFGLGRNKIRELAFKGDIPGMVKASW